MSRTARARTVAGSLITLGFLALTASAVAAWPQPDTTVAGGACTGQGTRAPIVWVIVNQETGNPGSPATVAQADVTLTPAFPTTSTSYGVPLPNTGSSSITLTTTVPDGYAGPVTLAYVMRWAGTNGSDSRTGTATVNVVACSGPVGVTPPPGPCGSLGTSTTLPPCQTTTTMTAPPGTTPGTRPPVVLPWCGPPTPTTAPTTSHPPTCIPPPSLPSTTSTSTTTPPSTTTTTCPPDSTTTTTSTTTTSTVPPTSTSTSTSTTTAAPTSTTSTTRPPPPPSTVPSTTTRPVTTTRPPSTTSTTAPVPPSSVTVPPSTAGPTTLAPATSVAVRGATQTLPVTGSSSGPLAAAGAALVLAGLALVRRQRTLEAN